jgi:hypothetical protein
MANYMFKVNSKGWTRDKIEICPRRLDIYSIYIIPLFFEKETA